MLAMTIPFQLFLSLKNPQKYSEVKDGVQDTFLSKYSLSICLFESQGQLPNFLVYNFSENENLTQNYLSYSTGQRQVHA